MDGARPDVGAVFGARFTKSGFGLTVTTALAPGAYTLLAFAHRTSTQNFDIVAQVPLTVRGVTLSDPVPCATGQVPRFDGTLWGCADNPGVQGATGPMGPQGPQGPQGPTGPAGATGPAGLTGLRVRPAPPVRLRSTGPAGPTGAAFRRAHGAAGTPGPPGPDQGPTGPCPTGRRARRIASRRRTSSSPRRRFRPSRITPTWRSTAPLRLPPSRWAAGTRR